MTVLYARHLKQVGQVDKRWHECYSGLHKVYEDYVMQSFLKGVAVSLNVAIRRLLCDSAKHPAFFKGLPLRLFLGAKVDYMSQLFIEAL